MRKLATIQTIAEVKPIDGADRIVAYRINGWWVVDQKDKYQVGDLVIFIEPDAWVPTELAPFLSKGKEPREFNGVKGEKLRTIRLKKQLSQGLILPVVITNANEVIYLKGAEEGLDVTNFLGIQKWEPPENPQLAGIMRSTFPSFIPKSDQERVQNLVSEIKEAYAQGLRFEITEKLEGSSMTCYLIDKDPDDDNPNNWDFGVCSKNIDLKRDPENTFWKVAIEQDIEGLMLQKSRNFAIQGELVGPGIQGNIYNLAKHEFYVYDVYDIAVGQYLKPEDRITFVAEMGLKHVPVLNSSHSVFESVSDNLLFADGKSQLNPNTLREGLVWKEINGGMTFKTVSNQYLEKHDA